VIADRMWERMRQSEFCVIFAYIVRDFRGISRTTFRGLEAGSALNFLTTAIKTRNPQVEVAHSTRQYMWYASALTELKPIAHGQADGYTVEERKAAFHMINQLERLKSNYKLEVSKDWHRELREPGLQQQIASAQRIHDRYQSREREQGRGRGMER
jgi:hypothetical protein